MKLQGTLTIDGKPQHVQGTSIELDCRSSASTAIAGAGDSGPNPTSVTQSFNMSGGVLVTSVTTRHPDGSSTTTTTTTDTNDGTSTSTTTDTDSDGNSTTHIDIKHK